MNCPGSASYYIHGDGTVVVNGQVPVISGESAVRRMRDAWARLGSVISSEAKKFGVNPAWVLGIMMQESGGVHDCSPCGGSCCETHLGKSCCAFGVMQMIPSTAARLGYSVEQILLSPVTAIEAGTRLLGMNLKEQGGDFVKAAVMYNAGSLRCTGQGTFGWHVEGDYARDVVRWSNTAISLGLCKSQDQWVPAAVFATGLAVAGMIHWDVLKFGGK